MFDNDRGKLGDAYTVNATLSLQTEEGKLMFLGSGIMLSCYPTAEYCNLQNGAVFITSTIYILWI